MKRLPVSALIAAGWSLAVVPRVAAQISIAPTIGVYIPTAELVKAASGEEFKQEIAISIGGRLGIGFGQRAGIEATVAYAPSSLKFSATGSSTSENASILAGTGRVFIELLPPTGVVSVQLNGGVGLVRRSGDAYQGDPDASDVGGVVGATVRFKLGSLLHLQVHAEDFVYKAQYAPTTTGTGFAIANKQLNDIHLSLGVGIPLLGLGSTGR